MDNNSTGAHFIFNNRKSLFLAIFIGAVLGLGVTFFIPKNYLSTAIIYPYNSHTQNNIISNPQFGYEVETEQLLQLLESQTMRDRTIEKFKLYDYYDMDTTNPEWKSLLALKYIKDITFFRSKYLSVVINVTTKDPQLSADIANYQVNEVNSYRESIFEENRRNQFNNIKKNHDKSKVKLELLKKTIYDIKGGDEGLLFNFIESLNNENYDSKDFINDPRLENLVEQYIYELDNYKIIRNEQNRMKELINEELPSVYTIDKALPSFKKVSPSMTINAAVGSMAIFLLVLTLKLVLKKWNTLKSEEA